MPYEIRKLSRGNYEVLNSKTGKVHAKHTSLVKAKAQIRLLGMKEGGTTKRKYDKISDDFARETGVLNIVAPPSDRENVPRGSMVAVPSSGKNQPRPVKRGEKGEKTKGVSADVANRYVQQVRAPRRAIRRQRKNREFAVKDAIDLQKEMAQNIRRARRKAKEEFKMGREDTRAQAREDEEVANILLGLSGRGRRGGMIADDDSESSLSPQNIFDLLYEYMQRIGANVSADYVDGLYNAVVEEEATNIDVDFNDLIPENNADPDAGIFQFINHYIAQIPPPAVVTPNSSDAEDSDTDSSVSTLTNGAGRRGGSNPFDTVPDPFKLGYDFGYNILGPALFGKGRVSAVNYNHASFPFY